MLRTEIYTPKNTPITINCKNFSYLRCENKYLFDEIIEEVNLNNLYVDIRLDHLTEGQTPGTGQWHYDSFDGSKEACGKGFLWVSGVSLTEFENYGKIPARVWHQYSSDLHRATPAFESGWRLLLRALELGREPKHRWVRVIR